MTIGTKAAYASHRGCSKAYVSKLVAQGKIQTEPDGQINFAKADAALEAISDPARQLSDNPKKSHAKGKPPSAAPPTAPSSGNTLSSYAQAKTAREIFNAKITELDYRERAGELVSALEVQTAIETSAQLTRNALLGLPHKMAKVLADTSEPTEVSELLDQEIRLILTNMSETLADLATPKRP